MASDFVDRLVFVVADVVVVTGELGASGTAGGMSEDVPETGDRGDWGDICGGRMRS